MEPLSGVVVPDPKHKVPKAKVGISPATAVGAGSKRRSPKSNTAAVPNPPRHIGKQSTAPAKSKKPPLSPSSAAAPDRNILLSLGFKKMSVSSGSGNSSQRQSPLSEAPHPESESLPLSASPQPESMNDSKPIDIDDDDDDDDEDKVEVEEDGVEAGSKRKLTSAVWKEFKRVKYMGTFKAKCMYCSKKLSGESRNGTKHLHDHLKICVQKKIKLKGKTLTQSSLRFSSADSKNFTVENYTFDQDIARRELCAMIVLHEYPLSIVDHVGFRRFVGALQPLFKIGTRNTIRYEIMAQYVFERKKAIEYMAVIQSKVAITTDLWTSDNQKRGYMAITTHIFIDES